MKVLWVLLVIYMCVLVVGDVVIGIRSWSSCTINKNVGRWPLGLVVVMVIFDTATSGTKFRREQYTDIHLIAIAIAYFGTIAWNIVGTIWFADIYHSVTFKYPNSAYCEPVTYWYVYIRLIVSWVSLFFGSFGVGFFAFKTRCRPQGMVDYLNETF